MARSHAKQGPHRWPTQPPQGATAQGRLLDNLPARMDQLVEAALQENWGEVLRVSELLAEAGRNHDLPQLAEYANRVQNEASKPNNELEIKRSIVRLISACGKTRTSHRTHQTLAVE